MSVVIETTIGDLTVDLFTEERPIACMNFIKLCKLKYYNFNLFHNIERDFIAQTGDPTGAGNGGSSVWGVIEGPSKRFFETETLPKINHTSIGLLSLVSPGKNLAGSQFFFTLAPDLFSLDGKHCVIGEVVEGHDTLRALNEAIVDDNFRPYQDIRITHTVVLEDPFPTMRGFREPSRSPSPSATRLQNGRIPADEEIDNTEGKSFEEIQEMLAEREAKARATILEIVGDLPDAEMAPPENVLFVCKLNPVTTDDDLEIIFSRFGKVVSCEVIRDKKTGDSLQYAFVEFEDQKSCEAAYFKMDNVLIDDRRIHVDFSQSVAKVKWRGKGCGIEGQSGRLDFNNLRGKRNDRQSNKSRNRENSQDDRRLENSREKKHREKSVDHSEISRHSRNRSQSIENSNHQRKDARRARPRSPSPYQEDTQYRDRSQKRSHTYENNSNMDRQTDKRNYKKDAYRDRQRDERTYEKDAYRDRQRDEKTYGKDAYRYRQKDDRTCEKVIHRDLQRKERFYEKDAYREPRRDDRKHIQRYDWSRNERTYERIDQSINERLYKQNVQRNDRLRNERSSERDSYGDRKKNERSYEKVVQRDRPRNERSYEKDAKRNYPSRIETSFERDSYGNLQKNERSYEKVIHKDRPRNERSYEKNYRSRNETSSEKDSYGNREKNEITYERDMQRDRSRNERCYEKEAQRNRSRNGTSSDRNSYGNSYGTHLQRQGPRNDISISPKKNERLMSRQRSPDLKEVRSQEGKEKSKSSKIYRKSVSSSTESSSSNSESSSSSSSSSSEEERRRRLSKKRKLQTKKSFKVNKHKK